MPDLIARLFLRSLSRRCFDLFFERAVAASLKESSVTAWIDPSKTNRTALEEAVTKRGVTVKEG